MSVIDALIYRLYFGPSRRIFRAVVRRLMKLQPERRIWFGPLKGRVWTAGEMVCHLGVFELDVQACMVERLKPGSVFYDVGAKSGFFSLLAAQLVGERGRVYAFEPLPENQRHIHQLLEANRIGNVTLAPEAVSDRSGEAELFFGGDASTPTLLPRQDGRSLKVKTTSLSDFAALHQPPDFIKMDIEGAETMAMEGAEDILSGARPVTWLIECHSQEKEAAVTSKLRSHGYQTSILLPPYARGRSVERHLLAWKD
jgi:FkbM family methyltransferase